MAERFPDAASSGAADTAVLGGFHDPVFGSQAVFAAVMNAFANPGTIAALDPRIDAPAPLAPAAAAIVAALADGDTPVYLDERLREAPGLVGWIAFHTGARLTADAAACAFAILGGGPCPALPEGFAIGTAEHPDRSATLLVTVSALDGGTPLVLSGPGIDGERRIAPRGLPDGFTTAWARNNALFPRGVDVLLVCGAAATALPRTTQIRSI
jgi:alpha-D-ribose 1-methylphosphonate 5-triphosphate synthase subunit PhnH